MGEFDAPRNFTRNVFDDGTYRLDSGEVSNPAKEVKPRYFRENQIDNQEYNRRTNCTPDSVVDVAGQITLNLPTGVIDAEHKVHVTGYHGGTEYQWTGYANADDVVIIQNAAAAGKCHLTRDMADIANYAAIGFVAGDFEVWGRGSENHIPKVGVDGIATGRALGSFNANDLLRDNTPGASDVDTDLTVVENSIEVEHSLATGKHDNQFLVEEYIHHECFINEGYDERVKNGDMELWFAAKEGVFATYDPHPYFWEFSGNAASELEHDTVNTYLGNPYSCKIISAGDGDMFSQSFEEATSLANGYVSGYVVLKGVIGRVFNIYLWGDVSGHPGVFTTYTATGGWDIFTYSRNMGADTQIRIIIKRDDVNDSTYYIGQVTCYKGRLQKGHGEAQSDTIIRVMEDSPKQWLINNNWDIWQETDEAPMGWEDLSGGGTTVFARDTSTVFGPYSCKITPTLIGDGIVQKIGDLDLALKQFKGKTVWAYAWLKQDVGASTSWKFELDDGVNQPFVRFDIAGASLADFTLMAVPLQVNAAAAKLDWKIYQDDGALDMTPLIVSSCGLVVGDRPIFWKPRNSVWEARDYVFWCNGSCATASVLSHRQEIMETIYPIYLSAYAATAPGLKDMSFKLYTNFADRAFSVNIALGVNDGHEKQATLDAVNTDIINPDDYIHIQSLESVPGGTNPMDIRVVLRAYTLSI